MDTYNNNISLHMKSDAAVELNGGIRGWRRWKKNARKRIKCHDRARNVPYACVDKRGVNKYIAVYNSIYIIIYLVWSRCETFCPLFFRSRPDRALEHRSAAAECQTVCKSGEKNRTAACPRDGTCVSARGRYIDPSGGLLVASYRYLGLGQRVSCTWTAL